MDKLSIAYCPIVILSFPFHFGVEEVEEVEERRPNQSVH
jgi:hypothetical protein